MARFSREHPEADLGVHLSLDDEEIRAVTNSWEQRWHEYQIFTDPNTRALIDSLGIQLIGYKELRGLFGQADTGIS